MPWEISSRDGWRALPLSRSVHVYCPRKWTVRATWTNCLKYEVMHLHFSAVSPRFCYVSGADHEVVCGLWNGQGGKGGSTEVGFNFRGDGPWLGLTKRRDSDTMMGWCATQNMFVADVAKGPEGGPEGTETEAPAPTPHQSRLAHQHRHY